MLQSADVHVDVTICHRLKFQREVLVKEWRVVLALGARVLLRPCVCAAGRAWDPQRGYWGITLSMNLHYWAVIAVSSCCGISCIEESSLLTRGFAHLLGSWEGAALRGSQRALNSGLLKNSLLCEKAAAPTGSVSTDSCWWHSFQSLWKSPPKVTSFGCQLLHVNAVWAQKMETLKKGFWGILLLLL